MFQIDRHDSFHGSACRSKKETGPHIMGCWFMEPNYLSKIFVIKMKDLPFFGESCPGVHELFKRVLFQVCLQPMVQWLAGG